MSLTTAFLFGVIGQCFIIEPPICVPLIRERTYFFGYVESQIYVEASFRGHRISVPVINGYSPLMKVTELSDGSILREYRYDPNFPYEGGILRYGEKKVQTISSPPVKAVPFRYSDQDFEEMQNEIKQLNRTIQTLKEKKSQEGIREIAPEPVRVSPKSNMKKPSEFGLDN